MCFGEPREMACETLHHRCAEPDRAEIIKPTTGWDYRHRQVPGFVGRKTISAHSGLPVYPNEIPNWPALANARTRVWSRRIGAGRCWRRGAASQLQHLSQTMSYLLPLQDVTFTVDRLPSHPFGLV